MSPGLIEVKNLTLFTFYQNHDLRRQWCKITLTGTGARNLGSSQQETVEILTWTDRFSVKANNSPAWGAITWGATTINICLNSFERVESWCFLTTFWLGFDVNKTTDNADGGSRYHRCEFETSVWLASRSRHPKLLEHAHNTINQISLTELHWSDAIVDFFQGRIIATRHVVYEISPDIPFLKITDLGDLAWAAQSMCMHRRTGDLSESISPWCILSIGLFSPLVGDERFAIGCPIYWRSPEMGPE